MAISIFHCCCCSWPATSCVSSREVARHGNLPREKEYGDHTWQSWSRGHQFQKKNKAIPSLQDWMAGGLCMDKYHIETHHPTHTAIVICIKEISVKWLHVGNTDRFSHESTNATVGHSTYTATSGVQIERFQPPPWRSAPAALLSPDPQRRHLVSLLSLLSPAALLSPDPQRRLLVHPLYVGPLPHRACAARGHRREEGAADGL
jgi:hypothetical protein